ncbi:MAG: hydroxyphenylacetyl-CoA thioesterase PaaI [Candidatus Eremiobacteraeota bacterium]|nr:hydroxyphenylacetyl-CoA thioesterase PaaI [Candidatus Eremiobacteraeota bacterium]
MYAEDAAARTLGISIDEVRPGYARLRMTIGEGMINGHDVAHGGFVFTLADTAFAYACNSRNERNVALNAAISFAAPARRGETLTAVAEERSRAGRTGVYDVVVSGPAGETVALFRGTSYRISGTLVAE